MPPNLWELQWSNSNSATLQKKIPKKESDSLNLIGIRKKITDSNKSSLYYLGNLESLLYILNVASCFGNKQLLQVAKYISIHSVYYIYIYIYLVQKKLAVLVTTSGGKKLPFFDRRKTKKNPCASFSCRSRLASMPCGFSRRGSWRYGGPLLLMVQKSGEKTTWDI